MRKLLRIGQAEWSGSAIEPAPKALFAPRGVAPLRKGQLHLQPTGMLAAWVVMTRWSSFACGLLAVGLMREASCAMPARAHGGDYALAEAKHGRAQVAYLSGGAVVIAERAPGRSLRGDFEPPDMLLLAYNRDWVETLSAIVSAARDQTTVGLLVSPNDIPHLGQSGLGNPTHVELLRTALDSPWVRDYGPIETYDDTFGAVWLDHDYTWSRPADDRLPRWLARVLHTPVEASAFVLDGGAVISNGQGLCALTATSLADSGLAFDRDAELASFLASLGCSVTAVLPQVPGERTGHADMIGQFLSPEHVMVAELDARTHPLPAARLDEAAEQLLAAAAMANQPLEVSRVPVAMEGTRFYSYVNATRLRTRLLVPRFSFVPVELEQAAYRALRMALPGVELVTIDADKLISHGGALHCLTLGLGSSKGRLNGPAAAKRWRRRKG